MTPPLPNASNPITEPSRFPIGELFVLGFHGLKPPPWLLEFEARHGLGGVILFDYDLATRGPGRNIVNFGQVSRLCEKLSALPSHPLIMVDQEGGKVRRLKQQAGFAPLPSAAHFASLPHHERTALAHAAFSEMRQLGFHYTLAPVVDLNLNPQNPDVGGVQRAFSHAAQVVEENVALLDAVARKVGLGLCLKHYPGLGSARVSSHLELTALGPYLQPEETEIFHRLGAKTHGEAILVSHGVVDDWDPGVPCTLSTVALGRLRKNLPHVLLISDDLQMQGLQRICNTQEACHRGLAAGMDLMLIGNNMMDETDNMSAIAAVLKVRLEQEPALFKAAGEALARVRVRKSRFYGNSSL